MIISVALHFALAGIGLLCFGAEGVRTQPLTEAALTSATCWSPARPP